MAENFVASCGTCQFSQAIHLKNDYLCQFLGVVDGAHHCKKYKFDPLKIKQRRLRVLDTSKYDAKDFEIGE